MKGPYYILLYKTLSTGTIQYSLVLKFETAL